MLVPVLLIGAIALMLRSFPVEAWREFIQTTGVGIISDDGIINTMLLYIYDSTFGFMSGYLVLSISYYYSFTFGIKNFSLQVMSMITSLSCFLASFGGVSGSLEMRHFGPEGVFTAMICSILATKIFYTLSIQLYKRFTTQTVGSDISYRSSITSIVPLVLSILVFVGINFFIIAVFQVSNFNDLISMGLSNIFTNMSSDLASGIIYVLVLNLLWFFGIHGGNAMESVARSVFVPANEDPTMIVSKTFLDNFALIGGCGATICMLVALLVASRTRNNRRLAYSATATAVFNINEPLVYGFPIVLNPVVFIPFLLVPVVSLVIAYVCTVGGLIPVVNTQEGVVWTTPPFFSGYLMTGSGWGAVVQLIIIAVGTLIYMPFIRLSERMQLERESVLIRQMTDIYIEHQTDVVPYTFLEKHDDIGMLAKSMLIQLREDVTNDCIEMHYMPQVDEDSRITGAEALLRWQFDGKPIMPPLIISLAQENSFYNELTYSIIRRTCKDIKEFTYKTRENIKISVNVNAEQLNDTHFIDEIIRIVQAGGIANNIVLEITEDSSIMYFDKTTENIDRLHENGISIAIDDFSMGQTSLKYLQSNHFDYVKLDGSLVKQIAQNTRSKDIIQSIITLGHKLGFSIVAEYVENELIRDELLSLGCQLFQGYLYSPAIPPKDFIEYYNKHKA